MASVEEVFELFKQLPDWDKYPMPEVFYQHFQVKKPKPSASIMEALTYTPPLSQSLNKDGKVELRPPAEGGVRPIEQFLELPVEVKMITEDGEGVTDETETCTKPDSEQTTSNPPTEGTKTETQPVLDHQSPNPSCDGIDSAPDAPCPDAECSPASQPLQNESS